jgi:alkylhydroperoxidase/carboxymuconolactone decarboxylase family protein YurZ
VSVTPRTSSARNEVRQVAPELIELSESVLYADVWERPGLSHLAFYSGWPTSMTTGRIARQVFEEKKS